MDQKFKINKAMKNTRLRKLCISLIILAITGIQSASSQVQVVNAGNDTSVCLGSSVTLNATLVSGLPTSLTLSDDSWSGIINLPFAFTFFGNVYNQCVI